MKKIDTETFVVEFWAKATNEVGEHEKPQTTVCESMDASVALESKFHEIGWPARAILLKQHTERNYLTSRG